MTTSPPHRSPSVAPTAAAPPTTRAPASAGRTPLDLGDAVPGQPGLRLDAVPTAVSASQACTRFSPRLPTQPEGASLVVAGLPAEAPYRRLRIAVKVHARRSLAPTGTSPAAPPARQVPPAAAAPMPSRMAISTHQGMPPRWSVRARTSQPGQPVTGRASRVAPTPRPRTAVMGCRRRMPGGAVIQRHTADPVTDRDRKTRGARPTTSPSLAR